MKINRIALDKMLEELAEKNFAISDQIFSSQDCLTLAQECQKLSQQGNLKKASIGRGAGKNIQNEIRGDYILWLDEHPFLEKLEVLRQNLNQFFLLSLKRVEAHFAFYPPGSGYDKHIDNHRGMNHRKITFVLYLNENWQKTDGGELTLFPPEDEDSHSDRTQPLLSADPVLTQLEPKLGTMILFRSEIFPHRVEKSSKNRLSLTGWFRDDSL